jgi:membrane protein YdbS with pleckstrin-like domain
MALIACPECHQQVSTDAPACPHCGKVLSAAAAQPSAAGGIVFPTGPPPLEQVLWEGGPSVALVYGKLFGLIVRGIILIVLGYILLAIVLPAVGSEFSDARSVIEENSTTIDWIIVGLIVVALVPAVIALTSALARIKNTHYKVTNQRILVEQGVLSKSLEEVDMRSVDDTEVHQPFLERLFGIGEVWIVSTDKVAPKVLLQGIHEPRKVRELIRSTAYQASQRQLFTRST